MKHALRGMNSLASHVIQELRCRFDARYQQVIPRTGAGNVEQMTLGVIDFFQVCIITNAFDSLLQRNNFIVASHYRDRTELQPFGQVHGADRDVAASGFDVFIEDLETRGPLP